MSLSLVVLTAAVALGASPAARENGWFIQATQDPISGVIQVAAQKRTQGAKLTLWCAQTTPSDVRVEVNIDDYLGAADSYRVFYRLDSGQPVSSYWHSTTKGDGTTIYPTRATGLHLIEGLKAADRLAVQSDTFDRNARPVVRVIDVKGAGSIIGELQKACSSVAAAP
jgi:hypothetical protein